MNISSKVVLLVDDDERNTFALRSYLESRDVKYKTAADGQEALSLLRSNETFDLVLLDMMMPVMDGYETLLHLRSDHKLAHIPVIALTAKAMKGDREKCLEAGATDYLSKPLDLKLLEQKMISCLTQNS
jgi:two-component system, chemotaxis family, sensor kinase CheA